MKRQLEPELMEDEAQVKAYAEGDFSQPHQNFVSLFNETFSQQQGYVLDLGCGAGDISYRFAKANPDCIVHGVDASETMLTWAEKDPRRASIKNVHFFNRYLPAEQLPRSSYDAIISNSLLHHLPEPQVLWQTINQGSQPKTKILLMDLMRPARLQQAQQLVKTYAANEPDILQHDFYHSLLAAFTVEEVQAQLNAADLALACRIISDRHFIVYGSFN